MTTEDPVLARIIDERPDFDPWVWMAHLLPPMDLYDALLWQVTGQQLPSQEKVLAIAEKWRPCRTLGTLYLYPATS